MAGETDSSENSGLARKIREPKPVRRILALDGGGLKGVFAIEILLQIEKLLRERSGNDHLLLSEYFDFIAGTSTGAIIATCLSWGMSMEQIRKFYQERAEDIFKRAAWYKRLLQYRFLAENISDVLRTQFVNDDGSEALLNTPKLKTVLMATMQNFSTGSAWPVTNNPFAKYNDCSRDDGSNLHIPLWKLVRASTAAPTFFEPEELVLGQNKFVFVDGALTPYNNPSLIAYLTATLPCYRIGWPTGEEKLLLVSVGNGRSRTGDATLAPRDVDVLYSARHVPKTLLDGMAVQQDMICRVLGNCLYGEPIDSEIETLIRQAGEQNLSQKHFSYVRYNKTFKADELAELERATGADFELDNLGLMQALPPYGEAYAKESVKIEHLL